MLSRLWTSVRYGIAAKLHLLTGISLVALAVLAAASIHFAGQTRYAAERLYREGILDIQTVTQLEVLFEQHRALVAAAPAELDRKRLQRTRLAVEAINTIIDRRVEAVRSRAEASSNKPFTVIMAQVPKLRESGDRVLMLAENFAQDKALEVSQGEYAQAANAIRNWLQVWYQDQISNVDIEVSSLFRASNDLILWVIASALVAFVLIGPVTIWIKHRILSRLGRITAAMHRLCNDELGVEVPYTKALDEMGDIARTIEVFKGNAVALGQAHFQLDAALNNMVQGLCMLDAQHRLVLCNDRFLEIFRLPRESVTPGIGLLGLIECITSANGFPEGTAERQA